MAGCNALEMASLRIAFAKLDADGNGTLTLDEMKAGARELGIDVKEMEALFEKMDTDGSGEIDYIEFADNYADYATQKLRRVFEKLDIDGSGTISLKEMKAGIQELGIDENDLEPLFRKMDSDNSGEVDYAEFTENLLMEMAGGWVGNAPKNNIMNRQKWSRLGGQALQVYVLSMEDLPFREEEDEDRKPQVFAVRVRWPGAPLIGFGELTGLAAYIWGTPRRRPQKSHGAYTYVDQTVRLPWVEAQQFGVLSVHQTDLLKEKIIGEVRFDIKQGRDSRIRRYPIYAGDRSVQGHANLRLILPEGEHRHTNALYRAPDGSRRKPPHVRPYRVKDPSWWSPFWLCSSQDLRYAESC